MPRIEHEGNAHDGFSFLGYTFRRQGSVYVAVPTDANRHKARSTLDSIVSRMMNKSLIPERRREAYVRARKFVKSWAAAFSLWDGAPDWRAERLAFVKNVWCQTQ